MKIFIKLLNAFLIIVGSFLIGFGIRFGALESWTYILSGLGCVVAVVYLDDAFDDKDK